MKGIKIILTVLMSVTLLFLVNAGFAQSGKKDKDSMPQQPAQEEAKQLITIIRNCTVPYIDTAKLYAVVETSVVPSEEEVKEAGESRGIGKVKSTGSNQGQIVQQTYEYAISPEVEIREQTEKGLRFDIETVAGVGHITKADIFVMKKMVVKIIIRDMQQ